MKRIYEYGLATAATDTSFPSRIPQIGTVNRSGGSGADVLEAPNSTAIRNHGDNLEILAYGSGSDNDTFDMRIIGWRRVGAIVGNNWMWVPTIIAQLACTMSASVGLAGFVPANTGRFVDTFSLTNGLAVIPSSFADTPASAFCSVGGFEYFEFTFDRGASNTDCNCIYIASDDKES